MLTFPDTITSPFLTASPTFTMASPFFTLSFFITPSHDDTISHGVLLSITSGGRDFSYISTRAFAPSIYTHAHAILSVPSTISCCISNPSGSLLLSAPLFTPILSRVSQILCASLFFTPFTSTSHTNCDETAKNIMQSTSPAANIYLFLYRPKSCFMPIFFIILTDTALFFAMVRTPIKSLWLMQSIIPPSIGSAPHTFISLLRHIFKNFSAPFPYTLIIT